MWAEPSLAGPLVLQLRQHRRISGAMGRQSETQCNCEETHTELLNCLSRGIVVPPRRVVHNWPNSGQIGSNSAPNLVSSGPCFVEFGRALAKFGRVRQFPPMRVVLWKTLVDFGQLLVELGRTLPNTDNRPNAVGSGTNWPTFVEFVPNLGTHGPQLAQLGPDWVEFGPKFGQFRAKFGRLRQSYGRGRSRSEVQPIWVVFGRTLVDFGHVLVELGRSLPNTVFCPNAVESSSKLPPIWANVEIVPHLGTCGPSSAAPLAIAPACMRGNAAAAGWRLILPPAPHCVGRRPPDWRERACADVPDFRQVFVKGSEFCPPPRNSDVLNLYEHRWKRHSPNDNLACRCTTTDVGSKLRQIWAVISRRRGVERAADIPEY